MTTEQLSRQEQLRQKRADWKQRIEGWQKSGLTQKAYCRQNNLKHHQFQYWRKRFVETETGITFVPLKIRRSKPSLTGLRSSPLRLIVDNDYQIEIDPDFDDRLLRRLIVTLRSLP